MRFFIVVVPASLIAGLAVAQEGRRDALDPNAKVPPLEYRSAFEGYRPFTDQELANWRRSNEEVGAAAGHAGKPGQGTGQQSSKPQPGNAESSGRAAKKPETPSHGGHGGHK